MKNPRKQYRPRAIITNPLAAMRPASKEQRSQLMLKFLTALEAMSRGSDPGNAEWRTISDAINTVETLAMVMRKLVLGEVMPVVNGAIKALVEASNRFRAGQGMRLDAQGLQALREVINIYDQCLEGLTEREMAMAQAETQRRVEAIQRDRRVLPGVVCL